MANDRVEIVGVGDGETSASGDRVHFVLEIKGQGDLRLTCATSALGALISLLTSLQQKANQRADKHGKSAFGVLPVQKIGIAPAPNQAGLGVILRIKLATGFDLHLNLPPELARDLAKPLASFAIEQLLKKN